MFSSSLFSSLPFLNAAGAKDAGLVSGFFELSGLLSEQTKSPVALAQWLSQAQPERLHAFLTSRALLTSFAAFTASVKGSLSAFRGAASGEASLPASASLKKKSLLPSSPSRASLGANFSVHQGLLGKPGRVPDLWVPGCSPLAFLDAQLSALCAGGSLGQND